MTRRIVTNALHSAQSGCMALMLIGAVATGCRDGVTPFTALEREPATPPLFQLTYNPSDDLNPVWSAGSDSIYYTAYDFYDYFPSQPSSILRVSIDKGIVERVAPDAQAILTTYLVLPVPSPTHDRVAYVHMGFIQPPADCPPGPCTGSEPLLRNTFLRVRDAGANGGATLDKGVAITFDGVDPFRPGTGGPYFQKAFPYQVAYTAGRQLLFRPTWAPDGKRIAFTDGLKLYIWDTAQNVVTPIPNTVDGVSPAWSPDGSRIAFARLVRGDSTLQHCICQEPGVGAGLPDLHERWTYIVSRSVVSVINPDGTAAEDLTDGQEPAWAPDANTIYFTRPDGIYAIGSDGGAVTAVNQTADGRSPSVSPDGRWLAFTHGTRNTLGNIVNQNVWLLRLGTP